VRFYIERHRADLQYWKKHHSGLAVVCYLLISCLHMFLRLIGHSIVLLFNPSGQLEQHKVKRSWACSKWLLSRMIGIS
ncbi:MAG: hypothetical protein ACXVBU_16695, partial [Ktedonobacteraceae bacterium]